MIDRPLQLPKKSTFDLLSTLPKQAVMHDEKVSAAFAGRLNNGEAGIHRSDNFANIARALKLKPVQCLWVIRYIAEIQPSISSRNKIVQSRHDGSLALAICSLKQKTA